MSQFLLFLAQTSTKNSRLSRQDKNFEISKNFEDCIRAKNVHGESENDLLNFQLSGFCDDLISKFDLSGSSDNSINQEFVGFWLKFNAE